MRALILLALVIFPMTVPAETVIATRTIRAQEVLSVDMISLLADTTEGAYGTLDDVVGQEARITLYPGRPILFGHLGAPAVVDRNQIVELVFERGGLRITSEGRALDRAAIGDRIRVMNLSSKTSLFGTVLEDGSIRVSQ